MRFFIFLIVIVVTLINPILTIGQTVLSGRVILQTDQSALRSVHVLVKNKSSSEILGFAVSKEDGSFSINVESAADSLWLVGQSMTIKKIELKIANTTQFVILEAQPSVLHLEEIIVEAAKSPVLSKNDTISFDLERFSNQNDRVLLDVLKRLPGIEVSSNGAISYRGESIRKFYIEGLDLLEGRYNIATRNLPVDAVKSVDILENHQPIRLLDSIEFTSQASINIKLKKNDVVIGRGYAGGGFPGIWDAKIAPMIFNKSFQSIVSIGSNNAGENLSDEILDFSKSGRRLIEEESRQWFQSAGIRGGSLGDDRYIFNRSLLASVNTIKKLENDLELKSALDYSRENIKNSFLINKNYFVGDNVVSIQESGLLSEKADRFRVNLSLEKNSPTNYFHNRLKVTLVNSFFTSDFNFENQSVFQHIRKPDIVFSNNFKKIITIGSQLLDFNSDVFFINQRPVLSSLPPFLGLAESSLSVEGIQQLHFNRFEADNYISYRNIKLLGLQASGVSGFVYGHSDLNTSAFLGNTVLGLPFENKMYFREASPYASLSFERNRKQSQLKLVLPTKFAFFSVQDRLESEEIDNTNRLVFEPEVYWRLEKGPYFDFRNSFRRKVSFGDLSDIYTGQIFTGFQTVQVKNSELPVVDDYRLTLRQSFKDPLISLFINSTISLNYSQRNTILENQVDSNGSIMISALNWDNIGKGFSWMGDASKFVSKFRTTFAVGSSFNWVQREIAVNENFQFLNYSRTNAYVKAAYRPLGKINFELKYEYDETVAFSEGDFDNHTYISTPSLSLIFLPSKNQTANFNFESLTINSNAGTSAARIHFLDLEYNYRIPKSRLEISLLAHNLLGQNEWTTVFNSAFVFVEDFRLLRPRQVVFRLGYAL